MSLAQCDYKNMETDIQRQREIEREKREREAIEAQLSDTNVGVPSNAFLPHTIVKRSLSPNTLANTSSSLEARSKNLLSGSLKLQAANVYGSFIPPISSENEHPTSKKPEPTSSGPASLRASKTEPPTGPNRGHSTKSAPLLFTSTVSTSNSLPKSIPSYSTLPHQNAAKTTPQIANLPENNMKEKGSIANYISPSKSNDAWGDPETILKMMTKNIATPLSAMVSPCRSKSLGMISPLRQLDNISENVLSLPVPKLKLPLSLGDFQLPSKNGENFPLENGSMTLSDVSSSLSSLSVPPAETLEELGLSISDDSDEENIFSPNESQPPTLDPTSGSQTDPASRNTLPADPPQSMPSSIPPPDSRNVDDSSTNSDRNHADNVEKLFIVRIPLSKLDQFKKRKLPSTVDLGRKKPRHNPEDANKDSLRPLPSTSKSFNSSKIESEQPLLRSLSHIKSQTQSEPSPESSTSRSSNNSCSLSENPEAATASQHPPLPVIAKPRLTYIEFNTEARKLKHEADKIPWDQKHKKSVAYMKASILFLRAAHAQTEKGDKFSREAMYRVYMDTINFFQFMVLQKGGLNLISHDKARASLCMKCIAILHFRASTLQIDKIQKSYSRSKELLSSVTGNKDSSSPYTLADSRGSHAHHHESKDKLGKPSFPTSALSPSSSSSSITRKNSPLDQPTPPPSQENIHVPAELIPNMQSYLNLTSGLFKGVQMWKQSGIIAKDSQVASLSEKVHISLMTPLDELADYIESIHDTLC